MPQPAGKQTGNTPDTGWIAGTHGMELRRLQVPVRGQTMAPLIITRLDPQAVRLRVAYAPEQPRTLREWIAEWQPILAANGGFFTEDYRSTALVVSDGVASGSSYVDFGGMIAVTAEGAVSIRALRDQPYDPHEPLDQAMQSFPMLVLPGGSPAPLAADSDRARRTVAAQDRLGRVLIIVSTTSSFTLPELAQWLAESDLDIDRALNLDGGASTGLYVNAGAVQAQIDSFERLPLVLLAEAR